MLVKGRFLWYLGGEKVAEQFLSFFFFLNRQQINLGTFASGDVAKLFCKLDKCCRDEQKSYHALLCELRSPRQHRASKHMIPSLSAGIHHRNTVPPCPPGPSR